MSCCASQFPRSCTKPCNHARGQREHDILSGEGRPVPKGENDGVPQEDRAGLLATKTRLQVFRARGLTTLLISSGPHTVPPGGGEILERTAEGPAPGNQATPEVGRP